MIHRVVTYLPTHSGRKFPEVSIIPVVLATLMIMTSFQTKLGEKIGILVNRAIDLWEGPNQHTSSHSSSSNKHKEKQGHPTSHAAVLSQAMHTGGAGSTAEGTSIHTLPNLAATPSVSMDAMHRADTTPLVNAEEGMTTNTASHSMYYSYRLLF